MKCSFIKDSGEKCEANAVKDSEFCFFHNPDISDEEKREAQTKGGANRALTIANPLPAIQLATPSDAVLLIADTINRVRAGTLDIRVANCLGFLSDKLLKAFEITEINDKADYIKVILEKRLRR